MANSSEECSGVSLGSLPEDILEQIINHLDLRSLGRLARSSRLLLRLTRAEPVWRRVAKALIGPWIHRSQLASLPPTHHPHTDDEEDSDAALDQIHPPPDWTLDPHCFPLSQFTRSIPAEESKELLITSWYQFSTRFLIPHFHFLGWHVSNILPRGQLILVTYDTSSGRLLAEEIKCQNVYSTQPDTFFIHPFRPGRPPPTLRSAQPIATTTEAPVWPNWLPSSQVQMDSNGDQYRLAPGLDTPDASRRYTYDIFEPVYVSSPLFSIFPFEPHYRLAGVPNSYQQITIQKPTLVVRSWQALTLEDNLTPLSHPTHIVAPRSNILSREVLSQADEDIVNHPGSGATEFHSLTLASSPEGPMSRVDVAANGNDRWIRYQGGARQQRVRTPNILLGGRTYTTNGAGLLRPVVHFPIWSIEYYPLAGPAPYSDPPIPSAATLEGLWVGCYGSHGIEFGKIILTHPAPHSSDSSSGHLISFVKLTGDPNVPAGQVSWKFSCDNLHSVHPISLSEAVSIDLGLSQADGGWLKGQGQVAHTNYEEPAWINTEVQLISGDHPSSGALEEGLDAAPHPLCQVQQMRVKWIDLGRVSTVYKVSFR
ncbi:hypothetical protein PCASD_26249 [Puccinia coronata f. sp. avenae]|uniref:F-box domain-containing protein n=1 Tax=Puccinia coronata f. sp. avenae TaxID=200324 RepID=A0A2N5TJ86_9BASI|nr:hypothetical protein PCASD_26249 [Puccinia coronata f. sp. avenae]